MLTSLHHQLSYFAIICILFVPLNYNYLIIILSYFLYREVSTLSTFTRPERSGKMHQCLMMMMVRAKVTQEGSPKQYRL